MVDFRGTAKEPNTIHDIIARSFQIYVAYRLTSMRTSLINTILLDTSAFGVT